MLARAIRLVLVLGAIVAVCSACPGPGSSKRSTCNEQVDTCMRRCNLHPEHDEAPNYRADNTLVGAHDNYAVRGRCERACLDLCSGYTPSASGLAEPATGPLDPAPPPPAAEDPPPDR